MSAGNPAAKRQLSFGYFVALRLLHRRSVRVHASPILASMEAPYEYNVDISGVMTFHLVSHLSWCLLLYT